MSELSGDEVEGAGTDLSDRVAIVTGAGKGIGAATAELLARSGADVVVNARTPADVAAVADRVRASGRRALEVPGDVNDLGVVDEVVRRSVGEFGRLDIVVNNAGGSVSRPALDTSVAALERSFHLNVSVPFELTRLAAPHLLESPGSGAVVNVSSMAGVNAARGSLTHSLTKAALNQLTRLLAADLAPRIRVNAVLPGAVETEALRRHLESRPAEVRATMLERTAMRRNGTPGDIARAVLFLASPASSWMTGKLLELDGMLLQGLLPTTQPDL